MMDSVRSISLVRKLLAITLVVMVALFMTACSGNGSTSSAPASASSTASSGDSEEAKAAMKELAGTWELGKMEGYKGGELTTITSEKLDSWRERGFEMFLVLKEDGAAVQVHQNKNFYGEWKMSDKNDGYIVLDGAFFPIIADESKIAIFGPSSFSEEYVKGSEDKSTLSEEEYKASCSAFVGAWNLVSVTIDGTVHSSDEAQLPLSVSLEISDDMIYACDFDGDKLEGLWGVNGVDSGYLDSPAEGPFIELSDGLLNLEIGDVVYSLAKE